MVQLVKKTFSEEQRHVWICGKNTSKTQFGKKKSTTVPGEPLSGLAIGSKRKVVKTAMACSDVGTKILQEMWEGTYWEGV